jgi:hypothetical protein
VFGLPFVGAMASYTLILHILVKNIIVNGAPNFYRIDALNAIYFMYKGV